MPSNKYGNEGDGGSVDFIANANIENQISITTQLPWECNILTQRNPMVLKCMASHLLVIH